MQENNWMIKGYVLADYLEACKTADPSNFKRDLRLTAIFEHTSALQGYECLKHIKATNPALLDRTWTNDLKGNPVMYDFGHGVYASPSTLQYIAVLANLIELCGPLDAMRIVEVGGGYGGQCRTVLDVFKPKIYDIVDLLEVLDLQKRYLEDINKHDEVAFACILPVYEYDLFISNYALSEIKDNAAYIELASRCKHGYIACNTDFVKLPWEHARTEDITKEPNNYILKW